MPHGSALLRQGAGTEIPGSIGASDVATASNVSAPRYNGAWRVFAQSLVRPDPCAP